MHLRWGKKDVLLQFNVLASRCNIAVKVKTLTGKKFTISLFKCDDEHLNNNSSLIKHYSTSSFKGFPAKTRRNGN